jgi:ABC-type polysaccharide/polyol phosphate transport system ATPase subunit
MPAIVLSQITKTYPRSNSRLVLRTLVRQWLGISVPGSFAALKGVSFTIEHGESVAVVGSNGAGKSTLLALIAGVLWPDRGEVRVEGSVSPLLELGAGFHPDLTGRENLRLNASLLGMTRREADVLGDRIVEFSELGEFIREPLRTYSAGMIMRLGFAIAVSRDPDILLVDEILAVGDQKFQDKCLERIRELKRQGATIVFVSHARTAVEALCERALWLDHGRLAADGPPGAVLDAYAGRASFQTASEAG